MLMAYICKKCGLIAILDKRFHGRNLRFAVFTSANVCAFSLCMATYHFRFTISITVRKIIHFPSNLYKFITTGQKLNETQTLTAIKRIFPKPRRSFEAADCQSDVMWHVVNPITPLFKLVHVCTTLALCSLV